MKKLLIIVFVMALTCVLGQVSLCNKEAIQKLEKKFYKASKKHKTVNREFGDMAYQIAECYRQTNDTVSNTWYLRAIEIQKGLYIYYKKSSDKLLALKRTALSYYYSKQYKEAVHYFGKITNCIKSPELIECLYFEGLSYIQLEQFKEALVSLKSYKSTGDEKFNVDSLIISCEDKINGMN